MIELTEQQRQELTRSATPRAVDTDPDALYPLLAEICPEDWEDSSNYGVADK